MEKIKLDTSIKEIAPYTYIIENVLTPDECQIIIDDVKPRLEPSMFLNSDGVKELSNSRTSFGAIFEESKHPELASKIRKFIHEFCDLPIENQERLGVFRYEVGQEYRAHDDWFKYGSKRIENGGQRQFTFQFYLNEGFKGGGTRFKRLGIETVPKTGMVVVWRNVVDGEVSSNAKHSGEPVIEGTKWIMPVWVRENKFTVKEN